MYHPRLGLESLAQKGRSPLYQDLIDLVEGLRKAVSAVGSDDFYVALYRYSFEGRFKAIVREHIGPIFTSASIYDSPMANAWGLFDVVAPKRTSSMGISNYTAVLSRINALYDANTGSFHASANDLKLVRFHLALTKGFLTVQNDQGQLYFSDEEVAAIILHELGHLDYKIRTELSMYRQMVDASSLIESVQANPDPQMILRMLDLSEKKVVWDREWKAIITCLRAFFSKPDCLKDPDLGTAMASLSTVLTAGQASSLRKSFERLMSSAVETQSLRKDEERNADEYAARNGSYQALLSGVAKLQTLDSTEYSKTLDAERWGYAAAFVETAVMFLTLFYQPMEMFDSAYDPTLRRLEMIIETAKHAFADDHLPEEVKADIGRQIAMAQTYFDQYRSTPHRRLREAVKQWKANVSHFKRLVALPFANRLAEDYHHLQEATRSLSRHPLYYLADKVQR